MMLLPSGLHFYSHDHLLSAGLTVTGMLGLGLVFVLNSIEFLSASSAALSRSRFLAPLFTAGQAVCRVSVDFDRLGETDSARVYGLVTSFAAALAYSLSPFLSFTLYGFSFRIHIAFVS